MGKFYSTKTYGHNIGLSCAFRQAAAALPPVRSRCALLHGYSLSFSLTFECSSLDERQWVMNFGGLKEFKKWLEQTFDHTTAVALSDPHIEKFKELDALGIIDLRIMPAVGCERFAEMAFNKMQEILETQIIAGTINNATVRIKRVEVREHEANSAIYEGDSSTNEA